MGNAGKILRHNIARIILCTGLLGCLAYTIRAENATASLKQMIDWSRLIFIGHITEVIPDGNVRIAKVSIDKVLKGRFKGLTLYFRASPRGICNIDGGDEGETGIYFFDSLEPIEYCLIDNKITNVLALACAGQGRLVAHELDRGKYIYASEYANKYVYPTRIKTTWIAQTQGGKKGIIKIEDIVSFISARTKRQH